MKAYLLLPFCCLFFMGCSSKHNNHDQPLIIYDSSTTTNTIVGISDLNVKPTRVLHITDSHITFAGPEDEAYAEYSSRMAAAYEKGNHYKSGELISRTEAFSDIIQEAKQLNIDLILLTGDILNYPSKRAVEYLLDELTFCGIPFLYTAGNHDWHLEGLPGSSHSLREQWREKILLPLYQGENPSHYARQINGVNFLMIDNSTYQITSEQVNFLKRQSALGLPMVIGMHIPVSIDGQSQGIGSREWGASVDKGFELERRERWPEEGHNKETYDFVEELFKAPVSIVLCGHIHISKADRKGGFLQFVTPMGRYGHYRILEIIPVKNDR
jgi:DNA repair exonuclease SbcCD nuclease subunit